MAATIEFEADTNNTFNTDESWIFLRGGWGRSVWATRMASSTTAPSGANTIAAGTGGLDGSDAVISAAPVVYLTNTNDATKIRYYTPNLDGISLGVSYTPTQETVGSDANNGDFIARKGGAAAMQADNVVEGTVVYDGDLGGVGILASVVGLYGKLKNGADASLPMAGSAATAGGACRPV